MSKISFSLREPEDDKKVSSLNIISLDCIFELDFDSEAYLNYHNLEEELGSTAELTASTSDGEDYQFRLNEYISELKRIFRYVKNTSTFLKEKMLNPKFNIDLNSNPIYVGVSQESLKKKYRLRGVLEHYGDKDGYVIWTNESDRVFKSGQYSGPIFRLVTMYRLVDIKGRINDKTDWR
jgi:hypothetical protein